MTPASTTRIVGQAPDLIRRRVEGSWRAEVGTFRLRIRGDRLQARHRGIVVAGRGASVAGAMTVTTFHLDGDGMDTVLHGTTWPGAVPIILDTVFVAMMIMMLVLAVRFPSVWTIVIAGVLVVLTVLMIVMDVRNVRADRDAAPAAVRRFLSD
ncbi:hypothetical protein [Microbacterium gorillae]|uniref:hypothetical protein n=1 Tax=Microbacterium gorillae TaxID=1231063 RepID=UPI000591407B|nr:hypothetical protein [Microbacterium gorillae]